MTQPVSAEDIRSLWQKMPSDTVVITVEEMRAKAHTFERRVSRRNLGEYIASALVIVVFSWYATFPEPATPLWPIGNILIVAATLFVAFKLHRGRAARAPSAGSVDTLIGFHRVELARQRDMLLTVWRWYLLPFAPGLVLMFTAMWIGAPAEHRGRITVILILMILLFVAVAIGIVLLNLLAATRLQRMIDDLDRYTEKK
jgi:hypothetical protein